MKSRLSLMYFAIFSFVGIHMPFWPVWLQSRGIDALGIAALTALSFALKIVVTPWVSRQVDRSGKKREAVIWLALGLLIGCSLFRFTNGFAQVFLLTTLAFASWSPIMSLAESITTVAAKQHQLDYGRIRLWGSIAFMIVATVAGKLLATFGSDVVLYSLVGTAGLLFVAALLLPATAGPARPAHAAAGKPAVSNRQFLSSKWFVGFLLATMLIQGSHAAYYTFASIHWRAEGLSDQLVGLLWGISVFSEIGFFAFGKRVVDRLGSINVIVLGGLAAAVRWTVIGLTVNPVLLGLVQLLHAVSFGASHFAAIRLIAEKVDDQLSATGQGLYSAFIMGIGMGIFVLASGPLYQALGHQAFYLMSAVAVLGTGVMLAVRGLSFDRITAEPAPLELRAATVNT